ncbi:unnamed protein product [Echinostoma caproni]|uniref:Uncharacterized protein n=1 Tax=Echinostoma caproni TaxID=27848 RepID=A0A183ANI6_9TREM|nr:unnamed protein product [Echinostoma caproni]
MMRRSGTQFEVSLPWQSGSNRLRASQEIALHRLNYLKGRLKKSAHLKEAYCNAMKRNLELGYIEPAAREAEKERILWYLPHQPVINPKKPLNTMVVFDCVAERAEIALNHRLIQGPVLTTPLIEVLGRFRLGSAAAAADIDEMFIQVTVPEGQRDAPRYFC